MQSQSSRMWSSRELGWPTAQSRRLMGSPSSQTHDAADGLQWPPIQRVLFGQSAVIRPSASSSSMNDISALCFASVFGMARCLLPHDCLAAFGPRANPANSYGPGLWRGRRCAAVRTWSPLASHMTAKEKFWPESCSSPSGAMHNHGWSPCLLPALGCPVAQGSVRARVPSSHSHLSESARHAPASHAMLYGQAPALLACIASWMAPRRACSSASVFGMARRS
mmetsp:Transcript_58197/g.182674  ORF Transcript_58197/g.182674 Transcript_58197/m.182674 type:complete len:223 (+) Transcript_58197:546-1214(+)